ncbi:small RNA degrading nuclease 1-like isoform X1 [Macadamia integrifolia]|uniref:small RNA degrading nuclease 1-like isoform X1 n=1 Tax=Macadamia integrifolia TaxID=60698 RepID=UPI001C52CCA5|nr:small RNA degrading nuclease 1-like isoform X1 [Macadamia integrifolia]
MSPMDKKIDAAEKEVLADIVRWTQKNGMKGAKGGWKEFLNSYDKKFGSNLSDPARRTVDTLAAFLKTFTNDEDLKVLEKVMRCHSNRKAVVELSEGSPDLESPQQRLVRMTLEHPQYPINYSFPFYSEEWVVTKLGKSSESLKSNAMAAIDCEMVLCEDGTEAVVKVCVVDHNLEVKLNELVNPNKAVADYRTLITGVSAKDLCKINCSLADVQKSLKKLVSRGTILVGHSLNNDLKALKLDHARIIDTSFIFKVLDGRRRPSLKDLCKSVLGYELRKEGAPHNCLDDALAAMKLVLAKIEHGFDDVIMLPRRDVSETELEKLLLHRLPIDVPKEELLKIFPEEFEIEFQPKINARGQTYSAFAIFKDGQKANEAFERVRGYEVKDSCGRPQKLVSIQRRNGLTANLYVRKMGCADTHADPPDQSTLEKKYPPDQSTLEKKFAKVEELINVSKKRKTDMVITEELAEPKTTSDQCVHHAKEIKSLKRELRQKDDEIHNLQKILSALTRKHGL